MTLENTTEQIIVTASDADLSIISLIMSSDFIGKSVIAILVLASIWSWAIIISKLLDYSAINRKMKSFEKLFWSGQALDSLYNKLKNSVDNPLTAVFICAIKECKDSENKDYKKSHILGFDYKERIIEAMQLVRNREIEKLETKLGFLATVGSSAPFIGLLGTVWGIMHSFQSIASSQNTSLAVVAPGIAEALLATAIGLFAAIPASVFYNYLSSKIDNINNQIDDFIIELGLLITRAADKSTDKETR